MTWSAVEPQNVQAPMASRAPASESVRIEVEKRPSHVVRIERPPRGAQVAEYQVQRRRLDPVGNLDPDAAAPRRTVQPGSQPERRCELGGWQRGCEAGGAAIEACQYSQLWNRREHVALITVKTARHVAGSRPSQAPCNRIVCPVRGVRTACRARH